MESQNLGPVTIEEVREALEKGATNANSVRIAIGRGSNSTIQKHLDTIRADAAGPSELPPSAPVAAPKDLADALWSAAMARAEATVGTVLTNALLRANNAEAALSDANADLAAAHAAHDEVSAKLEVKTAECLALAEKAEEAFNKLNSELEEVKASSVNTDAARVKEIADLHHQLELITRDREIERNTLNATIAQLAEQMTEYKALLMNLRPAQQ